MEHPSIEQVGELVRRKAGLRPTVVISAETQLEHDLGITGDDGVELLRAAEKEFGVAFTRESFNLKPDEYLFGPESSLLDIVWSFRQCEIRPFSVGDLHTAICEELTRKVSSAF